MHISNSIARRYVRAHKNVSAPLSAAEDRYGSSWPMEMREHHTSYDHRADDPSGRSSGLYQDWAAESDKIFFVLCIANHASIL